MPTPRSPPPREPRASRPNPRRRRVAPTGRSDAQGDQRGTRRVARRTGRRGGRCNCSRNGTVPLTDRVLRGRPQAHASLRRNAVQANQHSNLGACRWLVAGNHVRHQSEPGSPPPRAPPNVPALASKKHRKIPARTHSRPRVRQMTPRPRGPTTASRRACDIGFIRRLPCGVNDQVSHAEIDRRPSAV